MPNRLFYFAPYSSRFLNERFSQNLYVGPALNKILGVCGALRANGVWPVIVSGYIPWRRGEHLAIWEHLRTDKVSFAKLLALGNSWGARITSSFSFLIYSIFVIRQKDRVLLYNCYLEYIPAALYLKFCGNPALIDLEDAPRKDDLSFRGFTNRLALRLLKPICSDKCVTISELVSSKLGFGRSLPVYGVSTLFQRVAPLRTRSENFTVLFGGAISIGTGLLLFVQAIKIISDSELKTKITFFVTGRYILSDFVEVVTYIRNQQNLEIFFLGELDFEEYWSILASVDLGLCLKLPSHSLGQTTFPSKVIEYASFGVLLCSTKVGDVPLIFDNSNSILVDEEPSSLAFAIINAANNPELSASMAAKGRQMVLSRFSESAVGAALVGFIFGRF